MTATSLHPETVTVESIAGSANTFILRMSRSNGCDSIVTLTVNHRYVTRDTVYKDTLYVGVPYTTEYADHEFTVTNSGVLTYMDTLPGSNGCDSITTRILIVEEPCYDTICDRTFTLTQTWQDNVTDYCWYANGTANCIAGLVPDAQGFYEFPGQKEINGRMVDTVSYLMLTVLPAAESADVLDLCLYEDTYTTMYNENVSVTVNPDGSVMATSLTPDEVSVEAVTGSDNTFILRMTRVNGCDSIVTLTVNHRYVRRDTIYKDTLYAGVPYTTEFANHEFSVTESGVQTYTDTLPGSNGCDSITTRILIVEEPHYDTICDRTFTSAQTWQDNVADYCWYANGTANCIAGLVPDARGYYEFLGKREIDGRVVDTVSYLMLTVLPAAEGADVLDLCLYEDTYTTVYSENVSVTVNADGSVTATSLHSETVAVETVAGSANTFILRMSRVNGCDSIVTLMVNHHKVRRDTVYKDTLYAGVSFTTEFAGHEFSVTEPAVLTFTDTLPGSNGCDSITTRILIVEEPHHDTICDRTFTPAQTWQDNVADYCWYANGTANCIAGLVPDAQGYYEFPGQREINGRMVDTVSYLMLTVLPATEGADVLDLCLYEEIYTTVYNENVSVTVNADGSVTATSLNPDVVSVETVAGSGNTFILRMLRENGCDSIVTLTVNHHQVKRDTIYKDTLYAGTPYITEFAGHEFTITGSGVLTFTDTLPGSNGCDSITTRILLVEEPHYDTICDRTFTPAQTWQDNVADYCWYANGTANCIAGLVPDAQGFYEFPGQREVDGRVVDTVSYLMLTVLLAIDGADVLNLCLYGETYTTVYNENVSVTVNIDGSVTATSLNPGAVTVDNAAGSANTFILRMSRVNGCDSIVALTVNHRYVKRDTLYGDTLYAVISCTT
jgi:phage terminase large subunit-like protein